MPTVRGSVLPVFLASLGLAACAVGPNYRPPATPQAQSFIDAQPVARRQTDRPAPNLSAWWTGFGDPELSSLVARALDQNLDLAQAEARVRQARDQEAVVGAVL